MAMEEEHAQRLGSPLVATRNPLYICGRIQDAIPARVVLYIMSFLGFLASFMMRTDINIAMVVMARTETVHSNTKDIPNIPIHCYVPTNDSELIDDGEFSWDSTIQNSIIGCFYWCYIISQVAGGMLTQKFGTKAVFGFSQLITAISSLLIPFGAEIHWGVLVALRSIQGMASGLTWPAMYAVVGPWIPEHERSRFMSSFQGFSFGIGLTYVIAGFIIANFGWRVVFYVTGTVGLIWCIFWYFLAFDDPAKHPRISPRELQYIQSHCHTAHKGMSPPWGAILTSPAAWCIGITTFGRIWVHYTFMVQGPRYMKTVLGLRIQDNGILSGAPFMCSYLSSVFFCWVADKLHTKGLLRLVNIRKLNTILSQVFPGLLLLIIGYLGCDIVSAIILWFTAVTLVTAAYAGAMANIVDIAPNLAGPVLAFAQTIHMTASFVAPLVNGAITSESETLDRWHIVFAVAAVVSCVTYIPYQVWATADIQDWNYPGGKPPIRSSRSLEVLRPLQDDKKDRAEDL